MPDAVLDYVAKPIIKRLAIEERILLEFHLVRDVWNQQEKKVMTKVMTKVIKKLRKRGSDACLKSNNRHVFIGNICVISCLHVEPMKGGE